MNKEILATISNKLTAPNTALEKMANGDKIPREFLELALKELASVTELIKELHSSNSKKTKSQ